MHHHTRRRGPALRRLALLLLGLLLLVACRSSNLTGPKPDGVNTLTAVESYLREFQPGPLPRVFQTTYLYDRNGTPLTELVGEGRRTWIALDAVSPHLLDATIATEDHTFYINSGIDASRVAAAAWRNMRQRQVTSGASTITMQLARNLFLGPDQRYDQTMDRKMLEAGIAQELTLLYDKDELLEMYLNLLNYGHRAYGPEAAAQVYFNKPAAELSLAEASLLAGLPQQPAYLDPYRNLEGAKQRQRIVLDLMVRHGFISQAEADAVFAQPLVLAGEPRRPRNPAPHFTEQAVRALNARFGEGYVERSGLHVYTSLDLPMQQLAEEILRDQVATLGPRLGMSNAALVAMQPGTAQVMVMVGGLDYSDPRDGQVNVAVMPRQPGSAIKPVLYALALDAGQISPATVLWDTPIEYRLGDNRVYEPRNYDNRFHGLVTTRTALANSYNIPAVKVLDGLGVETLIEGAAQLGIRSWGRSGVSYGLSLALGAGEVRLLDLTTAYHVMANGGQFLEPNYVHQLSDSYGERVEIFDLYRRDSLAAQAGLPVPPGLVQPVQRLSSATAFQLTDMLSDERARQPSFGANNQLELEVPAAAKTGTTNDWRDNWTVGYTRYLVAGVWTGNNSGAPLRESPGSRGAAPMWNAFMDAVLADPAMLSKLGAPAAPASGGDLTAWVFAPPESVRLLDECPPQASCRSGGGEYFSEAWLNVRRSPLADTVEREETVYVHPYSGVPLYCASASGSERAILRLAPAPSILAAKRGLAPISASTGVGRAANTLSSLAAPPRAPSPDAEVIMFYPDAELKRFRDVAWTLRRGIPLSVGECDDLSFYEVRSGDHWARIADRFDVDTGDLQAVNAHVLRSGGVLRVGDRLLVPTGLPLVLEPDAQRYIVQPSDSWYLIAEKFDVDLRLLQAANPSAMRIYELLKPGDELFIPGLNSFRSEP